jgi:1-deoxy-D-xylulose-5-phosphate synthase
LAVAHKVVVTLEDNGVAGGVGSAVSAALRAAEIDVPCRDVGLPQKFFDHASRGEVLAEAGLTDQHVARRITGWIAALSRDDAAPDDAGRDGVEPDDAITEHLD